MILMNHSLRILIAILAVAAVGCKSPLDTDAPRIERPVTPPILVVPRSVDFQFNYNGGQFVTVGTPLVRVDTTISPAQVWIDVMMQNQPSTPGRLPSIKEFHIKVDSMSADGYQNDLSNRQGRFLQFVLEATDGVEHTVFADDNQEAKMLVDEPTPKPGERRRIEVTLFLNVQRTPVLANVPKETAVGRLIIEL
ncbi:MAG: hypothetical protein MUC47_06510 [Candidatus Kapabacteria bacterium]|nr:hypothetical protein [Candidatus Kapabacteria bacterium]